MTLAQTPQFKDFKTHFSGLTLLPGDAGYDDARQVWNAMVDRRPALVARCRSAEDVVNALALARDRQLPIAVRGGGHHIAGNAVCDDGVVIDLSLMKAVKIDVAKRRARVEAGCTLADFDAAALAHGLATPLGINSTTGVAGLTLGGGFGWLSRKHGMTVDSLRSADVVLADGRRVQASEQKNADLFWGLRGGSGNFGIVTVFEFELYPVGPDVLSGLIVFPFAQAKSVLAQFARFTETMPDELSVWLVARKAPPLPFLPEAAHGQEIVALALCYAGDPAEGERLIAPLRQFGQPLGEHVGVQPYTAWQQAFDPLLTPGARNYWKSHNFTELKDGVLDVVADYAGRLPTAQCEIFIAAIGAQTTRVAADAMAYASRDTRYVLNVHTRWDAVDDDARCIAWARDFFKHTQPYASAGAYVNFLTQDEGERVPAAYGAAYHRLQQLKTKVDPTNLLRLNQNVIPG